ncbi:hypothetical protein ACHAXR_012654 [Thalassiosira sp. AJA248-18]
MNPRVIVAIGYVFLAPLALPVGCCHALQTPIVCGHHRRLPIHQSSSWRYRPLSATPSEHSSSSSSEPTMEDDTTLLESVDPSTLQTLCGQYSLSTTGTKQEMLDRLREYANQQAEMDQQRRRGRTERVEANMEGKARHTIMDQDELFASDAYQGDGSEETQGYFYYAAAETEAEKKQREEERRKLKKEQSRLAKKSQSSQLTAPPPPEDIKPNEKGERVVTIYSTTDKNDLTGVTSQTPMADMSMENARYQQKSLKADQPEESLIGGPFGDTSGSKRKKADSQQIEQAKDDIREIVRNLLATTGAPAFQDDFEEGDETTTAAANSFSSPYGFTGFEPERIPPDLLTRSSAPLRADGGKPLKEILSEYELQAIGHDGMAADDVSQGGGHYREVEKVGSFLEGFRKAEERRVARDTSTMLLDRLVKEGVRGLDQLLAGMVREGDDNSYRMGAGSDGAGELNGALVRYLEEAIREQELRVKRTTSMEEKNGSSLQTPSGEKDEVDMVWNVTRGEDGTIIETIDPNNPMVGRMLREELEKTKDSAGVQIDRLLTMTVQEKMLLLLKLLRDRVKVEAVIGNDEHARNLRILAYCLKAANDEERQRLITDEIGNSLDSLDIFSDLVTASIDYAEARSNDDFMPGERQNTNISPVLDVAKLQKINIIVERIKASQSSSVL